MAVSRKLIDAAIRTHEHGTRFEVGRLAGSGVEVALALVGKGTHPAAVLAERAIGEFAPAALIFVGVAGALHPNIELGDIVVATHVYAYHGGTSENDGPKSRPRVWETSHRAEQIARHLARHSTARVHFGPIAAGEMVLNSRISEQARWVREHYNDALAIEMEAAGVAQAGHLSGGLPVVVVRGISDRADGTKEATDRDRWQQKAIVDAATFAIELATELAAPAADGARPAMPRNREADTPTNVITHNFAGDNAHVGFQASQVYGPLRVVVDQDEREARGQGRVRGGTPDPQGDLADRLADFRRRLRQTSKDDLLDGDEIAAAEDEISKMEMALTQAPPDRQILKTAPKRLAGLVVDVPELADRMIAIMNLVRGMQ
jgi:8-oxo-dGTP diphosphatase